MRQRQQIENMTIARNGMRYKGLVFPRAAVGAATSKMKARPEAGAGAKR